jgi:hypothetical protein
MYLNTIEGLGLGRDLLQTSPHPFHGVVSSKQSIHLRQINLSVTFRGARNYRTEMLTFEVVNLLGPYHVILGQPCYVKFMAIHSYAYLKLKIPGPTGIITVEAKAHRALDCEQASIELATAVVTAIKLMELCLNPQCSSVDPSMPSTSGTFKATEDAKAIQIDAEHPVKTVQIRTGLIPK